MAERQSAFPEHVQARLQRLLNDESIAVDQPERLAALKLDIFAGLLRTSAHDFLCKYRGHVEFPYTSLFDSTEFVALMRKREVHLGWTES